MINLQKHKNLKLFNLHIFVRSLFFSIVIVGWVYLFFNGVSLITLLVALLIFRSLQILVFMKLTFHLNKILDVRFVTLIGLTLQSLFIGSFYFAHQNIYFLLITVILGASSDSLYYTSSTNLERILPKNKNIGKSVGGVRGIENLASIIGIFVFGSSLYLLNDFVVFAIVTVGTFLSFLPIFFLNSRKFPYSFKHEQFKSVLLLSKGLLDLFKNPLYPMMLAVGIVGELVESVIPIFLAFYEIKLIEVVLVLVIAKLLAFFGSLLMGAYEDKNKNFFFYLFGILSINVFIIFTILSHNYLPMFLIVYSFIGAIWELSINIQTQKYVSKHLSNSSGGIFYQFHDNLARGIVFPITLLAIYGLSKYLSPYRVLFIISIILILITFFFRSRLKRCG